MCKDICLNLLATIKLKSTLKSPTAGESCCAALRMEEPDEAILPMRAKGARGPDDIPPTFLKALGPRAEQGLLDIFNLSISSASPQTPCVPFAKGSSRRSNTGYEGGTGSMELGRTYLEVLLHPLRSLPPTLKGCWRSQGSPSGRPLVLKPQPQQQRKPPFIRYSYNQCYL